MTDPTLTEKFDRWWAEKWGHVGIGLGLGNIEPPSSVVRDLFSEAFLAGAAAERAELVRERQQEGAPLQSVLLGPEAV